MHDNIPKLSIDVKKLKFHFMIGKNAEDLKVNIYNVIFEINLKTIVNAWIFDSRMTFGIQFMLFKSCYF